MTDIEDETPEWVGGYRRVRTLGRGSYGEVSLFTKDGSKYAIKRVSMLHPVSSMVEISMYTMLSHPHIMKPYEYIATDRGITMNIVMAAVDSTLHDMRGTMPYDDIKIILWQLLSAIDYMHSNGIMHRDLKPANILMDGMYTYIIDFGLATYVPISGGRKDHTVQTYPYRAPEVYEGAPYGYKADMFSLGAIMYELIYGRTLLSKATPDQMEVGRPGYEHMMKSIEKAAIKVESDLTLPQEMKDILIGMIEPIPDARLGVEDAMHMPWFSKYTYHPPDTIDIHSMDVPEGTHVPKLGPLISNCQISEWAIMYTKALVLRARDIISSMTKIERSNILKFLLLLSDNIRNEQYMCGVSHMLTDRKGNRAYSTAMNVAKVFETLGYNIFMGITY